MDREDHVRRRQEAIARKKARRERQLAIETKVKPKTEWFYYPDYDPVEIVRFRMNLVAEGKKIYSHNDEGCALYA